jgi:secreted PhoX family phosphatase
VRDFVSLCGTIVNCAGGPTPWGTWITCEETTAGTTAGWTKPHGYVYEVPVAATGTVAAVPLKALGRFTHEAVAVDPRTNVVYETEDQGTAGLYRFLPDHAPRLEAGGKLQMLAIEGKPGYDTRTGQKVGAALPVTWVDIATPDPPAAESQPLTVFNEGHGKGGATFSRLEGIFYGSGKLYVHATDGGDAKLGQVWEYTPVGRDRGVLRLLFESTDPQVLEMPDNLTVSPRGGIVICEDGEQDGNFVRGLTPDGKIFDFANNILNSREFAGAAFSPDGKTLFVNIQGDGAPGEDGNLGMTFAIWGPWERGAL